MVFVTEPLTFLLPPELLHQLAWSLSTQYYLGVCYFVCMYLAIRAAVDDAQAVDAQGLVVLVRAIAFVRPEAIDREISI